MTRLSLCLGLLGRVSLIIPVAACAVVLVSPTVMFWQGPKSGSYYPGDPFSPFAGVLFHLMALVAIAMVVWTISMTIQWFRESAKLVKADLRSN